MKAVVLAAGQGLRIWPLAENRPKHLLPIGGKPIITYLLEALAESNITEVFLIVGFKGELIRSTLGDGTSYGLTIEYLEQPRWTGTAAALKIARRAVGNGHFLALYGDLWLNSSAIQTVVENSRDHPRVMGIVRVTNPTEFGAVEIKDDRIRRIIEKPSKPKLGEGWVNAGIYVLDEEALGAIDRTPPSKRSEYELTSSLQLLLDEGKEIRGAMIAREDWMDIGRPWDLLEANERVLVSASHRVRGRVEQGAILKGTVWLEENALVKSGSYVEGPVYVGKGTVIGPNTRIRPFSSIGNDVTIGTSCEVKNSIIMNGTRIPHLSYVGDSIVGENCNLGAGTITANLRFDEETIKMKIKGRMQSTGRKKLGAVIGDFVQTGINVSIMPGVRIGSHALVGAGIVLSEDVASETKVFAKQIIQKRRTGRPDINTKPVKSRDVETS